MSNLPFEFRCVSLPDDFTLQVWYRGLERLKPGKHTITEQITEQLLEEINLAGSAVAVFKIPSDGSYQAYGHGFYNEVTREIAIRDCTAELL